MEDELIHYGVLGMHWGVRKDDVITHHGILGQRWGIRRTPEELGHAPSKPRDKIQKYKAKELKKIDKMYERGIRSTEKALVDYPDDEGLKKQLENLNKLKDQDRDKIEKMTYTDVMDQIDTAKAERREKMKIVAEKTVRTAGEVTLWASKMAFLGVRVYGIVKAGQIVGEFGMRAVDWLQSPEGQAFINSGMSTLNSFMSAGDKLANMAAPDVGKYLDPKLLADTSIAYGKTAVEQNFGSDIATAKNLYNKVGQTAADLDKALDKLPRRA